jgi:tRNA-dihydrouridine synthase 4
MHNRSLVASMITSSKNTLEQLGYRASLSSDHQETQIDTEMRLFKTISVKIRIHKDLRQTIDFVRTIQDAGVDFITVHGRTRSTPSSTPVNLEAIKLLREHITVPVLSNGDVFTMEDVNSHVKDTAVDGVMAARGLLENPALFSSTPRIIAGISEGAKTGCTWDVVETFMRNVIKAPLPFKLVVHHINEMVGSDRSQKGETLFTKEERRELMECKNMIELLDFLDEVRGIRRQRG